MITKEENERLTKVGADTPMGTLLRRYWPVPERQIETSVVLRKPLASR